MLQFGRMLTLRNWKYRCRFTDFRVRISNFFWPTLNTQVQLPQPQRFLEERSSCQEPRMTWKFTYWPVMFISGVGHVLLIF